MAAFGTAPFRRKRPVLGRKAADPKLAVDFAAQSRPCVFMDHATRQAVIDRCTQAGALMEDASAPAVLCGGLDEAGLRKLAEELAVAIDEMRALVAQAAALLG